MHVDLSSDDIVSFRHGPPDVTPVETRLQTAKCGDLS
jgi:hypothetical protein